MPQNIIRNSLSELIFNCPYKPYGCDSQIRYETFLKHVKKWDFQITRWPAYDKCNTELPLKEYEQHVSKCGFILIQCDFCDRAIERRKMESHLCKWDEMEMLCEFCEQLLKRKYYEHHISNQCKEYNIQCVRCNRTFKRKDEDMHHCIRHLTNCQKNMNDEI